MTSSTTCLLYSADTTWAKQMTVSLASLVVPLQMDSPARIQAELEQQQDRLLLLDLQTPDALDLLTLVSRTYPHAIVIAFGVPGSDPMILAEQAEIYATEHTPVNRLRLNNLVQRALRQVALTAENRLLRQETLRLNVVTETIQGRSHEDVDPSLDIRDFSAALRHFAHVDTLLHRLVDEVADALRVSRIGIFCRTRDIASYRLRAGLRCLESASLLEYGETHRYVLWLTVHTHAVTRSHLERIRDVSTRLMLQDMLDQLGAEVLIPLQSHHRLLGWMFVGHLSSGVPFEKNHLDHLISLTECVSTTLENALLYEEATIQKTLAETLLHSMPSGIIAVDDGGIVRWYNDSARKIFGVTPDMAIGRPIEGLGSHLADLLRGTLGEHGTPCADEWVDAETHRNLVAHTQRLANQAHCLGAVAVVQDTTDQRSMKEQQDRLDRATFWTELAASLSHEVRNPLVAIKTFAQLLPERYGDKEFQNEFRDLVSSEVERLNGIVDLIHTFANPPPLTFRLFPLRRCLENCVARLFPAEPGGTIRVNLSSPELIPNIEGDERALQEAFVHILQNAKEALATSPAGEISISITVEERPGLPLTMIIGFKDNGPGIPEPLLEKIFSPFSTTKARGLGLGLPITRRTILDHRGDISVHSNSFGVLVTLRLPIHHQHKDDAT